MNKKIILLLLFLTFKNTSETPVYLTAIPKTGSNLLGKCLKLITNKSPGPKLYKDHLNNLDKIAKTNYFNEHRIYSRETENELKKHRFKGVFILRDPRDQVISFSHHIKRYGKNRSKIHLLDDNINIKDLPISDIISLLIKSIPCKNAYERFKVDNIGDFYTLFIPWKDSSLFYTTYFEKLIGPKGGATKEEQEIEIKNIAKHLGYKLNKEQLNNIANNLFGGTWTFRSGQIGEWKKIFTKKHKELFKKVAGDLLIKLGYEKNYNW